MLKVSICETGINKDASDMLQDLVQKSYKELLCKKEVIIKDALQKNGFDINDIEFIQNNFESVSDASGFDHLYYHWEKEDEKRIVSIERPHLTFGDNGLDFINNCVSYKIELKYY